MIRSVSSLPTVGSSVEDSTGATGLVALAGSAADGTSAGAERVEESVTDSVVVLEDAASAVLTAERMAALEDEELSTVSAARLGINDSGHNPVGSTLPKTIEAASGTRMRRLPLFRTI